MDGHTLDLLEWPRVLELLAAHTSCGMGREAALALAPSAYPEVVARRLQETREARAVLDRESGMPLGGIRDVRGAVERAARDLTLAPMELLDVAQTVASSRRLKQFLCRLAPSYELLREIGANLPVPPNLERRIGDAISESAEVRDSATPDLARIRNSRKVTHNRLMDRLNQILTGERHRTHIQEPIITLREGRYCIPVKAESRNQVGGIVHDASASGATVFLEPGSCVELGNDLRELAVKEEQEVSRILSRLSSHVGESAGDLRALFGLLANIDMVNARALLAEQMDAVEPRLNHAGHIRLNAARHPLLTGQVVPVDIEVGRNFTVVLVTGPNTGGKTVLLKTVGLLTLMAQAGMQIPASADSDVALFEQVCADIGDEQDIQQSLSTFSAHLRNIASILDGITASSLVLLDELGAGTDPAEGAALAKALLDELLARGARVVATTHYGELKEYAYAHEGVENAAMEFDRDTLRPTYRVMLGVPGSSQAFYIAGRLGLRSEVVERARGYLSKRDQTTGELLQQIEAARARVFQLERDAAADRSAAAEARADYERRSTQVADVQRTVRRQTEEEARAVLRRASEKAENLLGELKKMNRGQKRGSAVRLELANLRRDVSDQLAPQEEEPEDPAPPEGYRFAKGDTVRVITIGADGRLLEDPHGGEVAVQIGAMRATLPVTVLRPSREKPPPPPPRDRQNSQLAMQKAIHISPELSLRALRVDEAGLLLEKYLDDAFAAGIPTARIIHGKGTGALRKFVQQALQQSPVVAGFRLGDDPEGGDGVTVVTFRR